MDIKFTLEQARKHRGLTQEQIAKMLGMTKRTYIDYEQYKRAFRIDKAFLFAEIVDIPIDNIIFFNPKLHLKCRKDKWFDLNKIWDHERPRTGHWHCDDWLMRKMEVGGTLNRIHYKLLRILSES